MSKVSVATFDTETNKRRTEYRDAILFLLNVMNVNFILLRTQGAKTDERLSHDQLRVASGHILSAIATGKTISTLLSPLSICSKDALPLARTFNECLLNASFVLSDGGDLAERASKYTIYKLFRSQNKYFDFGTHRGRIQSDYGLAKENPFVAEAVSMFGKKKDRRIRPCFKESRSEKILSIGRISPRSAILFQGVEEMSWDLASEVAHGSHFSLEVTQSEIFGSGPIFGPEAIGEYATNAMVCSVDAYLRILRSVIGEVGAMPELAEAIILFYQEEAPELAEGLDQLK